ncbi:MAG: hypothetical protein KGV46_00665 [Pasteurella sp.]|nr:hypothetical protein [Pasteurella sp.]
MSNKQKVNEAFKKAEQGDKDAIRELTSSQNGIVFNENGQLNPGFASQCYRFMAQIKARSDIVNYFQECIKLDIQARYERAFQEYQSGLTKTNLTVLNEHADECHKMIKNIASTAAKRFNELSMQISEDDADNMEDHKVQHDRLDEQKRNGTLNDSQYNLRVKSLDDRYANIFSYVDSSFNDFMRNQQKQLNNTLSIISKFIEKQKTGVETSTIIDADYQRIDG